MAGFAKAVSICSHVLETIASLGGVRRVAGNLATFLLELDERGKLDWSESFLDGSFVSAKKGDSGVGNTKRGKGTKWMVVVDGSGIPLGSQLTSASPTEVKLAESTLTRINLPGKKPPRIIADRAYDSDPLLERLLDQDMLLIAPHRRGRTNRPSTTDAGCVATAIAGKWSAPLPGLKTTDGWSCDTSITCSCIKPSFMLLAS